MGRHLGKGGVSALAYLCTGVAQHDFFDFGAAVQLNRRPALLGESERKSDILEAAGDPNASFEVRFARLLNFGRSPTSIRAHPTGFFRQPMDHSVDRNPLRQRRAHRHKVAFL